jgi:phospholipid/cholesterol/gamma-HCH transport system substrate-binding protein
MEQERRLDLKVGLFVVFCLALLVASLLVLGGEQNLFERNYALQAEFHDIAGLRTGASVRLAGLDVGLVTSITFPTDLEDRQVYVRLKVAERFQQRIREDSVATIEGQGLLGDKFVSLSLGSPSVTVLQDGDRVKSVDPVELTSYLDDVPGIMANVNSISEQIDKMLKGEDGEKAGQSISQMLASLRNILAEVEEGKGIIHQLVYDKKSGRDLRRAIDSIQDSTQNLSAIMADIRNGDGALHNLIYEDKVSRLLDSLRSTAGNIDVVVREIQTGNGLIHDLVYTDEGQSLLANLTDASAEIKEVVSGIKRGEGTLGALVVDPTLYQDIKSLLGRAERSKILKAYVRDTIRRNERSEGLPEAGQLSE